MSDVAANMEAIRSEIAEARSGRPHTRELVRETALKFSRGLLTSFKHIRVETNRGSKLVDINNVYVPCKLVNTNRSKDISQLFQIDFPSANRRSQLSADDRDTYLYNYTEFRNGFRKAVILGDPGGGKSTLCQFICFELSKKLGLHFQYADKRQEDVQNLKFPIRVVLRSFEFARTNNRQLNLFDYICGDLANYIQMDFLELTEFVRFVLCSGQAILAFDGLDEILDTGKRREYVELVSAFSSRFPLCPVLVTSRFVGYQDAPLPEEFETLILEKFDEDEIREYVIKFSKVVEGIKDNAVAQQKAESFLRQTQSNASDLRQNPLMLGLMAFLFALTGDVPTNRPRIYQECALLLFERWDPDRNIKAAIPGDFDLLNLITFIASKIYSVTELEEGISESWLRSTIQSYFNNQYENISKSIEASKSVVKFITGRAWVMSQFAPDVYKFTHRTFLEYFYARHIDHETETIKELFRIIKPHILRDEWEVISHLAVQLKTYRNQKKTSDAVAEILSLMKNCGRGKKRKNAALMFAAKSMEYLQGTEGETRAILEAVYEGGESLAKEYEYSGLSAIGQCYHVSPERRDYASGVLTDLLVKDFKEPPNTGLRISLILLAQTLEDLIIQSYQGTRLELTPDIKNRVIDRCKPIVVANCAKRVEFSRLNWDWIGVLTQREVEVHGFNLFLASYLRNLPQFRGVEINPISVFALAGCNAIHVPARDHPAAMFAMQNIELFGRNAARLPLIAKNFVSDFREGIRIPEEMWSHAISETKSPDRLSGLVVSMLAISELISYARKSASIQNLNVFGPKVSQSLKAAVEERLLPNHVIHRLLADWSDGKSFLEH